MYNAHVDVRCYDHPENDYGGAPFMLHFIFFLFSIALSVAFVLFVCWNCIMRVTLMQVQLYLPNTNTKLQTCMLEMQWDKFFFPISIYINDIVCVNLV